MTSNSIYVAKVKSECTKYVDGVKGTFNHCFKDNGDVADVGAFRYIYSIDFCKDSNPRPSCLGAIAYISLGGHWFTTPPVRTKHHPPSTFGKLLPYGSKLTADELFQIDAFDCQMRADPKGKYITMTHLKSGRKMTTLVEAPWRMVRNSSFFNNPTGKEDARIITLTGITKKQFTTLPDTDDYFMEEAVKLKLYMGTSTQGKCVVIPITKTYLSQHTFSVRYVKFPIPRAVT